MICEILDMDAMCLISVPLVRYGAVSGEEFAPGRFHRRSYHYWEIPFLHVQLTPIQRQDETSDLEKFLVQQKLIRPSNESQPRWDMVRIRRAEFEAPPGDALILCRYLDQKNAEGELIWLAWSKKETTLAKALWPAVAEAARREMYILVPELFHLAEKAAGPDELKQTIAQLLAPRYEEFARVEQQLGNSRRAAEWFAAALRYDPQSHSAAQGRDQSLQQAQIEGTQNGQAP
jgi:hypothetical protein